MVCASLDHIAKLQKSWPCRSIEDIRIWFCALVHYLLPKMLTIEVQLPEQEDRKKIEWNKVGDPTFDELKGRLQQCGVPDDWCVEVLRGSNFILPDLQTHIHGPKITVRASPILGHTCHSSHTSSFK